MVELLIHYNRALRAGSGLLILLSRLPNQTNLDDSSDNGSTGT